MVKYTHIIERCSSFLRTGIALRLKVHDYTFTEAYWRLREGKGLQSSYDKESLKIWSNLITCVRRSTGTLSKLKPEDQARIKVKRNTILERMEEYRDKLEHGCAPQYLYDHTSPHIIEHLMVSIIGDVREATPAQQQEIWENLDIKSIKTEATRCMKEINNYTQKYLEAKEGKENMSKPEDWAAKCFGRRFVKDKIWQIRTGHDIRSSVNAGINDRLLFIWDIPSQTNVKHRKIYENNLNQLEIYKRWKEDNNITNVPYETILLKVHEVLDSIEIPD